MPTWRFLCCSLVLALCACGGGGSSLPGTSSTPAAGGGATTQSVRVSIRIPALATALGSVRRPAYVSTQTQSATIAVNGGLPVTVDLAAGSPACTTSAGARTCAISVSAPVGADTFALDLYATTNGTGAILAQGTVGATIVAATANSVQLTLDGVPASAALVLANPTPTLGSAQTIGLSVTVKDGAGGIIIGGDPFVSPITLTDSDTSGATTLSKTILTSPGDAANLSVRYTGAPLATPAVFGATGGGLSSAVATATLTPQGPASVTFNDYTTYGYDVEHDKFNPNSTALTPTTFANLHLAWQTPVGDFNTQTQPVLATNVGGHAGLLVVGGASGHIYAFDATTGSQVWRQGLGYETFSCNPGDGDAYFGVGGTVAYDPGSKSFYVAGSSNSADNAVATTTLFHIDAATGQILGSVNFSPNPIGPSELDFSHTSVTLGANGLAYVGTGATCDISSWRGRVAAISVPSMQLVNTFFTVWNSTNQPWGGGGVWGYGGVSLDPAGNVFTGVGNTDDGTTNHGTIVAPFQASPHEDSGYGDAFLALNPGLSAVYQANHPIPESVFGSSNIAGDLDLNGTPLIVKAAGACDEFAAIQGKSGALYFYDTTNIGGGPLGTYQLSVPSFNDEFLGDPAYSPVTGLIYSPIPIGTGTLFPPGMMALNPGCGSPYVAWHTVFGPDSDISGGKAARSVPAVSAGGVVLVATPCVVDSSGGCNGDLTAASVVARKPQALRKPQICCNPPGSGDGGALWALDAATGAVLNDGKPFLTTPGQIRLPATIDGNWVYVLDNSGNLYGFTLDPTYPTISGKYRQPDARSHAQWEPQPRTATPN